MEAITAFFNNPWVVGGLIILFFVVIGRARKSSLWVETDPSKKYPNMKVTKNAGGSLSDYAPNFGFKKRGEHNTGL